MDVAAVLQSVEERDKWRQRLEALRTSLAEVTFHRRETQGRLRKIRGELRRLGAYSDALLDRSRNVLVQEVGRASGNSRFPPR